MNSQISDRYQKISIAFQHYLFGARYYDALKAYDYAKRIHTGMRKDGITPEFQHQIEMALFITTLRDVQDEEGTIITALLHDTLEDYPDIKIHLLNKGDGYAPNIPHVCGGDDIDITFCLDCGQIQHFTPLTDEWLIENLEIEPEDDPNYNPALGY